MKEGQYIMFPEEEFDMEVSFIPPVEYDDKLGSIVEVEESEPPMGVLLPPAGVRLWAVLLSVMVDVIMVGLWGANETGSVAVAAMGSVVGSEAFMDVMLVVWPDTDNVGKRMPNKRKCRATVKPKSFFGDMVAMITLAGWGRVTLSSWE